MLYPQSNAARAVLDLSGFWSFRLREGDPWQPVAVPASYNDQSPDPAFRNHAGPVWYKTRVSLPSCFAGKRAALRFDAVAHSARIFLNGKLICSHRGGFLPFEADLTGLLAPGESAELLVEADNRISHSTLPIGVEDGVAFFGSDNAGITAVEAGKRFQRERGMNVPAFDFFNYTGINRPVRLCVTPEKHIRDVTLVPSLDGTVRYEVDAPGAAERGGLRRGGPDSGAPALGAPSRHALPVYRADPRRGGRVFPSLRNPGGEGRGNPVHDQRKALPLPRPLQA